MENIKEKAILVGLELPRQEIDMKDSLLELASLAEACDIDPIDTIIQKAQRPTANFYIGSGKVKEIKEALDVLDANIVIFDDELSPAHIRNLEKELECKVIDRSLLILDIFARRAKSKEAMLEVELAQLKYMLPRLIGLSSSLSRQAGSSNAGFSAKGPGEKKLELDRRVIETQMSKLKRELSDVVKQRRTQRQKRSQLGIPIVALVGYTNAGKSATMNSLLAYSIAEDDKTVFEEDMLFATLQTHTRRIEIEKNRSFLLIDTVGFIAKLPHHLVNSFKSTLEEVLDADLILHIVDAIDPKREFHATITEKVLTDLGVKDIPIYRVYTKIDRLNEPLYFPENNSIAISNHTKGNIEGLIKLITNKAFELSVTREWLIPYKEGSLVNALQEIARITEQRHEDDGVHLRGNIVASRVQQFAKYEKKT